MSDIKHVVVEYTHPLTGQVLSNEEPVECLNDVLTSLDYQGVQPDVIIKEGKYRLPIRTAQWCAWICSDSDILVHIELFPDAVFCIDDMEIQ